MFANPDTSLNALSAEHGWCRTRLGKLMALSCLGPDIVTVIVEGRQPDMLTARRLMEMELPIEWGKQRTLLGVG